ncbi:MAG TPA: hypothetical protein VIU12_02025 [Chryseolinea sp.]
MVVIGDVFLIDIEPEMGVVVLRGGAMYEGDPLLFCPSKMFGFEETYAVVVSGSGPNFCGHLILSTGGKGGDYFHVAGVHTVPRMMSQKGYDRYLRENGKKELRRFKVTISNSVAAMLKVEELLAAKWTWGVLPHNCASFVEEVVQAGGSTAGLYSNCPALERFQ